MARVKFVKAAQRLGFSLTVMAVVATPEDDSPRRAQSALAVLRRMGVPASAAQCPAVIAPYVPDEGLYE